MPPRIVVIQGNITQVATDAVVNSANRNLSAGTGVCGALFEAAGHRDLRRACQNYQTPIRTGQAVITSGFASRARFIVHAVAPRYQTSNRSEQTKTRQLKDAYKNSLRIAIDSGCRSIAFPILGIGSQYPRRRACREAIEAIYESYESMPRVATVLIVAYGETNFELFLQELEAFQ